MESFKHENRHETLIPLFDELRGAQVVVRPYRLEDAEEVFAAIAESREHIRPWLPWGDQHQSVEDTRDFILRGQAKWLLRESDLNVGVFAASADRYLGGSALHIRGWDAPPAAPLRVEVKVRYKAQPVRGIATPLPDGRAEVTLEQPIRAVTPGQAAVFYGGVDGDEALGGGLIE